MYEDQTEDVILERMLSNVSDEYDKREGSIIYDSLAPASIMMAIIYSDLDDANDENDIDTASRDTVIDKCTERSITPKSASAAVLKVEFKPDGIEVPLGTRFNSDTTTYVTTGASEVTCEETGEIGNEYIGEILPIDNVAGLESATIASIEVYGEEEESTESLRTKYHNSFGGKAFGGNIAQYKEYTMAISGVGGVKVIPCWNGPLTTKLIIISSAYTPASDELVKKVQDYFDPNKDGKGNGMSPIGDVCTVVSAEAVAVNVTANITLDTGYEYPTTAINTAVSNYIATLQKQWADQTIHIVRVAQIESAILSVEGVIDISNVAINGVKSNLTLSDYQIPTMGAVTNG